MGENQIGAVISAHHGACAVMALVARMLLYRYGLGLTNPFRDRGGRHRLPDLRAGRFEAPALLVP